MTSEFWLPAQLQIMNAPETRNNRGLWRLARACFYLTPNERLALAVVFGLLLLGLFARFWHLTHEKSEFVPPPAVEQLPRP